MITTEQLQTKAEAVYHYMLLEQHKGDWGMDIHSYDWVPGVGLIAMLEYADALDRKDVMDRLHNWCMSLREQEGKVKVINSMAPYAIFPALHAHTQDEYYKLKTVYIADWMLSEAPRTREGAFEHTVTEQVEFSEQVWADTIFMAVLFLARAARLTKDERYAKEALNQLLLHIKLLQDPATGVCFHGWNCAAADHMSAARWTRANSWIAVGTPMILNEIKGLVEIPDQLKERYAHMMRAMVSYQQEDGLWPTVLDRKDFYPEVSGTAGIACGILRGMEAGLLDASILHAARNACQAVCRSVEADGKVALVSTGTPVMESVEAYNDIPYTATLYGQGLALMLFAQAFHHKELFA